MSTFEAELIHPSFTALIALAVANEQRPAPLVDVGLIERNAWEIRNPPRHSTAINARIRRP